MNIRLRCPTCQATYLTTRDQVGQAVPCPKCGATQVVPPPEPAEVVLDEPPLARIKAPRAKVVEDKESVFLAKDGAAGGGVKRSRRGLWAGLFAVATLGIALAVAWPSIRRWLDPRPRGVVEAVAYDYLKALQDGDEVKARQLGVVDDPPSVRSFADLRRDKTRTARIEGSFAPIARLHQQIAKKFLYDPNNGRFTLKDPLGPAAEVLDAAHEAKAKLEKDGTYTKMASGDPEEAMQAAIDFGGMFAKLSGGVLSPKQLIPSYKLLVQNAKPALVGDERALALDYARHRESWDRLLKRPFPDLTTKSPFRFDGAEVLAEVRDKFRSAGEPPVTLRLKLVRFQTDAIDTGWRVVSARRLTPGLPDEPEDEEGPEPQTPPEPSKASPGEQPPSPGLIPGDAPADTPK